MNQLNETLRIIRIQISAELKQDKPNLERIDQLRKEEEKCLDLIRS